MSTLHVHYAHLSIAEGCDVLRKEYAYWTNLHKSTDDHVWGFPPGSSVSHRCAGSKFLWEVTCPRCAATALATTVYWVRHFGDDWVLDQTVAALAETDK